jgi:hypothetical protein
MSRYIFVATSVARLARSRNVPGNFTFRNDCGNFPALNTHHQKLKKKVTSSEISDRATAIKKNNVPLIGP